jgi:hypothetical protein
MFVFFIDIFLIGLDVNAIIVIVAKPLAVAVNAEIE